MPTGRGHLRPTILGMEGWASPPRTAAGRRARLYVDRRPGPVAAADAVIRCGNCARQAGMTTQHAGLTGLTAGLGELFGRDDAGGARPAAAADDRGAGHARRRGGGRRRRRRHAARAGGWPAVTVSMHTPSPRFSACCCSAGPSRPPSSSSACFDGWTGRWSSPRCWRSVQGPPRGCRGNRPSVTGARCTGPSRLRRCSSRSRWASWARRMRRPRASSSSRRSRRHPYSSHWRLPGRPRDAAGPDGRSRAPHPGGPGGPAGHDPPRLTRGGSSRPPANA